MLQGLQPSKLAKLPKLERAEKLATLLDGNIEFPPAFSLELLAVRTREAIEAGGELSTWVERLNPFKVADAGTVSDPCDPALAP